MLSSVVENYRKELARYKNSMTVYATVKKNFPNDEELPFYSLDVEVEIAPKSEEDVEKNVISQLYKSQDLNKILKYYHEIQTLM